MSVHGIYMYIPTMSVRVYDMFGNFGFGIYMSTHIVKFTCMSVTCLATSIVNDMCIPCMYTFLPGGQDSRWTRTETRRGRRGHGHCVRLRLAGVTALAGIIA